MSDHSKVFPKNVLGTALQLCSADPVTGFTRNGCCEALPEDWGGHTVCAQMTDEFLVFSKSKGNDLSLPNEAAGFPGLKAGDRWCVVPLVGLKRQRQVMRHLWFWNQRTNDVLKY